MDDNAMFDYLVAIGQMRPEEAELKKKQAMVDALRKGSMTPQQGQMISGHYVGPGIAGAISQLGQAYFANKGQEGVDAGMRGMNSRQAQLLEEMRRRRMAGGPGSASWGMDLGQDDGYGFGGQ
jgi:hypothetical protein